MARKYVLDTHACVFTLTAPRKLGRQARAVIRRVETGDAEEWIPAPVVAEILLLREKRLYRARAPRAQGSA